MRIVFGLDGVLADTSHRDWRLGEVEPQMKEYHDDSHKDRVLWPSASLYRTLWSEGHQVEVWTRRPITHKGMTVKWFQHRSLPLGLLRMCPEGDIPSYTMKRIWYRADIADGKNGPDMVLARNPAEIGMWRGENVFCLQVFNGGEE